MNKYKIPYNKPFIVGKEIDYIAKAVLENSHISGNGPFTKRCQKWLEKNLQCAKALITHSGTGALEMAAILIDVSPGDEVIMPSFTFVSTANAFVLRGAIPVFVDIKQDSLNLDETLIEDAITPRTKAIIPVHYAGIGCAMDEILDIANRHNLFVVEDAVCSRTKNNHKNALHRCQQAGVIISNMESVLFEWLADAKHNEFRTLSKLIV